MLIALPNGKGQQQNQNEKELESRDGPITAAPAPVVEENRHDSGSGRRADAPEAVQPIHMAGLIMQGNIVVQPGINRACSQAERNGEKEQKNQGTGKGEAQQRKGSEKRAQKRDHSGAEAAQQTAAVQAGNNCAGGNRHRQKTGSGKRGVKLRAHHWPGCPQNGIRQAKTDEREINDQKKNGCH